MAGMTAGSADQNHHENVQVGTHVWPPCPLSEAFPYRLRTGYPSRLAQQRVKHRGHDFVDGCLLDRNRVDGGQLGRPCRELRPDCTMGD